MCEDKATSCQLCSAQLDIDVVCPADQDQVRLLIFIIIFLHASSNQHLACIDARARFAPQIDVTQDEIQCKSEHVRPVTLDGDDPILLLKLGRNQEIKMRMIARKVRILLS